MAGSKFVCTTAEIACVAATAKTVLQLIADAACRFKVTGWGIFFDGVSPTAEPVQVRLVRQTSAIGGTPTANNPVLLDDSIGDALKTLGKIYGGSPSEPTTTDVLDVVEVHPQQGYEVIYPDGYERICGLGDRIAIEVTAPANVNCRVKIVGEE